MTDLKETKKKAEEIPLWGLESMISKVNKSLLNLAGQGVKHTEKTWRRKVKRRNIYREVLLKKLNKWKKDKGYKDSNPSYNDYLEYIKHKSELAGEFSKVNSNGEEDEI